MGLIRTLGRKFAAAADRYTDWAGQPAEQRPEVWVPHRVVSTAVQEKVGSGGYSMHALVGEEERVTVEMQMWERSHARSLLSALEAVVEGCLS
jgi:hypothetical protein